VKQCPAASALSTPRPRSDIGRCVVRHAGPGPRSLHKGSLAFGAAVRLRLPSHTPSRERLRLSNVQAPSRAVAFTSRLPPIGPAGEFHPQSLLHAQRTRFCVPAKWDCTPRPNARRDVNRITTKARRTTKKNNDDDDLEFQNSVVQIVLRVSPCLSLCSP